MSCSLLTRRGLRSWDNMDCWLCLWDPRRHRLQRRSSTRQGSRVLSCSYGIDPLTDSRWDAFLLRHPAASVFHSMAWLRALYRTYAYEPIVFTTSQSGQELENGLLFCRVRSWLTGHRIVSVPFSDHCAPLCNTLEEFEGLVQGVKATRSLRKWDSMEVRPRSTEFDSRAKSLGFKQTSSYFLHCVDLAPSTHEIFQRLNKSCAQRRVRHAERVGLIEECGRSEALLRDFYKLVIRTRSRQSLPPQPYSWFRNLVDCMGNTLQLRLAYDGKTPVAAILVLQFKGRSYYKYGCSDERFHRLGAVPLLLWRAIVAAKSAGSRVFDLGRTEIDDQGLIKFKNHWSSTSERVSYWKFPAASAQTTFQDLGMKTVKRMCAHMPGPLLTMVGRLLYPHVG